MPFRFANTFPPSVFRGIGPFGRDIPQTLSSGPVQGFHPFANESKKLSDTPRDRFQLNPSGQIITHHSNPWHGSNRRCSLWQIPTKNEQNPKSQKELSNLAQKARRLGNRTSRDKACATSRHETRIVVSLRSRRCRAASDLMKRPQTGGSPNRDTEKDTILPCAFSRLPSKKHLQFGRSRLGGPKQLS